jgi:hypothetical protein
MFKIIKPCIIKLFHAGSVDQNGNVLKKPAILARWYKWDYNTSFVDGEFCPLCYSFRLMIVYPTISFIFGVILSKLL